MKASKAKDGEPRKEHLADLAFQNFVLTGAGVKVRAAQLMQINGDYVRQGPVDVQGLFTVTDLTEQVREQMSEVERNVVRLHEVVAEPVMPDVPIGPRCDEPHLCPYVPYCWRDVPDFSVFDVFGKKRAASEYARGVRTLADIRRCFETDAGFLTDRQSLLVECEADPDGNPHADRKALDSFLASVQYPVAHLDFESYWAGLPRWDGMRPYEQTVFQYSIHHQDSPGSVTGHDEFLAPEGVDPRRLVAEALVRDLAGGSGSVVVWNQGFEKARLKELAAWYPDPAEGLDAINDRIVDVAAPFCSKDYYDLAFKGSWSVKSVLPALFPDDPDLNYDNLDMVHNGGEASEAFRDLHLVEDAAERERVRKALLKYCALDTLATAKILNFLQSVQRGREGTPANEPRTQKVLGPRPLSASSL